MSHVLENTICQNIYPAQKSIQFLRYKHAHTKYFNLLQHTSAFSKSPSEILLIFHSIFSLPSSPTEILSTFHCSFPKYFRLFIVLFRNKYKKTALSLYHPIAEYFKHYIVPSCYTFFFFNCKSPLRIHLEFRNFCIS